VKTPEQKAAQRARAEARKKRRQQEAVGEQRVSKSPERHREAKEKVKAMDGVWLENGDGEMEKWRLTLDGHECVVVAKRGEVVSVRRCA
jgi:hypothetical protein